jgi:hypothetical protein
MAANGLPKVTVCDGSGRSIKVFGNTIYHDSVIDFIRCSEVQRDCDDKINTDMKHNYDMWCIIRKMKDLQL